MAQNRTERSKKRMLEALEKTLGVVSPALKQAEVGRTQFYQWLKEDAEFKAKVDAQKDRAIDFVETALFKNIQKGNVLAQMFYLKTQAKHRGYIEKVEQDINYGDKVPPAKVTYKTVIKK